MPSETDRSTSEFLFRACHDLRTSLRAIRSHSELLLKNRQAPEPVEMKSLDFIVDGAQRIDRLADGLAEYAIALQLDSSSFQPTPMSVMFRTVVSQLQKEIEASQARVSAAELPRVNGNPDRLMQVLRNLILNALQFRGDAPPSIDVAAERDADEWVFSVRDNGPGIDEAYLKTIFKPFERLGRKHEGPGLGLAICREIVERHGGRIWAESEPGPGTTFRFTLPAL
jgi:signal transduction histidine kinase